MPPRRPRTGPVNNVVLLAAVVILISCVVNAQQQQVRPVIRHESPHEGLDRASTIEASKVPIRIETPFSNDRRKKTINNPPKKNDVSALETLAPANPVDLAVAAPFVGGIGSNTGLGSPQRNARSLADWEVEDFVLLATIDGKLHARDRKSGQHRWELSADSMVSTTYNRSLIAGRDNYDLDTIDDYLWIIEPSQDGAVYIYKPGGTHPGLTHTGMTMKQIVTDSPYGDTSGGLTYIGSKTTTMVTIDAYTGTITSWLGMDSALNKENAKCVVSKNSNSCRYKTLDLGQTVYSVSVNVGKRNIATLKYSEWTPNTFDQDLGRQYTSTFDNKYIHTSHDGSILALDYENSIDEPGPVFQSKESSPVARVFDVARPGGPEQEAEGLIVLAQPLAPDTDDLYQKNQRASNVFINHTEDGTWYAMSGQSYPMAVQGSKLAECTQPGWFQHRPQWDATNNVQLSKDLVGLHSINSNSVQTQRRAIGGLPPQTLEPVEESITKDNAIDFEIGLPRADTIVNSVLVNVWNFLELLHNPILWILIMVGIIYSRQDIFKWWATIYSGKSSLLPPASEKKDVEVIDVQESIRQLQDIPENEVVIIPTNNDSPMVDGVADNEVLQIDVPATVTSAEAPPLQDTTSPENLEDEKAPTPAPVPAPAPTPHKRHRGRRGGAKHKKGPRPQSQGTSEDGNPIPSAPTIDDAVRNAQAMGQQKTEIEPDIRTMSSDPQEVSGPIIRIGALVVNTEKLIGTGSNGTMVFEGSFDGRDVAVKRMLVQFYDIASQETKLLRESDDHPNVIRYFAQQQAAGFLYIALELCPASLADVISKPLDHRNLAQAGERDLPHVLYQITKGVSHLHKLRIVHRDLKPQNILVSLDKEGRPRLLVSDFGLCKKLEGEQSSFRATTAHAAGTSGWRAPELLLDDDAKEGQTHQTMADASTEGHSGAIMPGADLVPARRATRAIDIFSLGLVFFYVLTKGSHPYDCGNRYMREINIRKGEYSLEQLDVLGDYAFEAKDLISSMLAAEPKRRPSALEVMAHPFFWPARRRLDFLCDVSDYFEKEKRDPPTPALQELERCAPAICGSDFLKPLGKDFVDSLGKQRKYTGTRLLDLLRALRNKKNHYEDMPEALKKHVGALPDGYLNFWSRRFPALLITCWEIVYEVGWDSTDRFQGYYQPYGGSS